MTILLKKDIDTEHKPLYEPKKKRRNLKEVLLSFRKGTKDQVEDQAENQAENSSEPATGGVLGNPTS